MKKLNRKGFTLIELLAVITIMGILMLVAIPAVQRTIENSRRDTFASTAKSYINAMKNLVASDEVYVGSEPISAAKDDAYYCYSIDTKDDTASDLMEQGGRSSWGNAHVQGYIAIYKKLVTVKNEVDNDTQTTLENETNEDPQSNTETSDDDDGLIKKTKYEYAIYLVDDGNHGIPKLTNEKEIKRNSVMTNTGAHKGKLKPSGDNKEDKFVSEDNADTLSEAEGNVAENTGECVMVKIN